MFGARHYVPALRWKQAERLALRHLDEVDRDAMTPLIELPLGYFDDCSVDGVERAITEIAVELARTWGHRPVFVDLAHTPATGTRHPVSAFASAARQLRIVPIHVTGLNRPGSYQDAVAAAATNEGGCIRLTRHDLASEMFGSRLRAVLAALGATPAQMHLIVDYEVWDNNVPSFAYLASRIPMIERWRTFTCLAGSFPPDLQVFDGPGQYEWPRSEWTSWRGQAVHRPVSLPRLPSFRRLHNSVWPPDPPRQSTPTSVRAFAIRRRTTT
jgi:hypothetical protein